jgi:putative oxidoreductase
VSVRPWAPGTVEVASLLGLAATLETLGGFFLLVSLFTRPIAVLLAGEMAVAYFKGHATDSSQDN